MIVDLIFLYDLDTLGSRYDENDFGRVGAMHPYLNFDDPRILA